MPRNLSKLFTKCKVSTLSNGCLNNFQRLRIFSTTKLYQKNDNQIAGTTLSSDKIKVHWTGSVGFTEYHNVWLRDHCKCDKCYNVPTNQRSYDMLHMPLDIKPKEVTSNADQLKLTWPDGHVTTYNAQWLQDHSYKKQSPIKTGNWIEPYVWNKQHISSVQFPKITLKSMLEDDKSLLKVSYAIEKYGFAFVHQTPLDAIAMETLINRLAGYVRETFYGKIWEFSNEAMDYADTAYTALRLEAHTDNTYFNDPAGLQLLHCIHHEGKGGESLLVDGFKAAAILKETNKEAFDFLSSNKIPSTYEDDLLCINSNGAVIELDPYWNNVKQIRFNMYDRDVLDCLAPDDVPRFYRAYQELARIIRDPENELWFKLEPGVCLVMANWRVLHGRDTFTGLRKMIGGYASKDDFQGQLRSKLKSYKDEIDV